MEWIEVFNNIMFCIHNSGIFPGRLGFSERSLTMPDTTLKSTNNIRKCQIPLLTIMQNQSKTILSWRRNMQTPTIPSDRKSDIGFSPQWRNQVTA